MNDILSHLLTGKDNKTHDIGRWTWLISLSAVIAVALWEVVHTNQVSIRELAEALGIVSAAGGASVAMKQGSEPQ
jgi:CHASE2 domain-containing sensor protein